MRPKRIKKLPVLRDIEVCGITLQVVRAHPDDVAELVRDGEILDGVCDIANGRIVVREGQPTELERDSIAHEVIHAFLYLSGLQEILKDRIGHEKFEGFEELLVRVATPHIAKWFGLTPTRPQILKAPRVARVAAKRGRKQVA